MSEARLRFVMQRTDFEIVDDSVEKYNPNHDARGRFAGGSTGGAALHRNIQPKLDAINSKIDALPKDPKITSDITQAKIHLDSASKSPTANGSGNAVANAQYALDRAAQKVVGTNTPLAYKIKDIRQDAMFLAQGLQRP